VTVDFRSYSY